MGGGAFFLASLRVPLATSLSATAPISLSRYAEIPVSSFWVSVVPLQHRGMVSFSRAGDTNIFNIYIQHHYRTGSYLTGLPSRCKA